MASLKHMFDQLTSSSPDPDSVQAAVGRPLAELESEICTLAGHLAAATCRFLVLLAEFDAREGWASWDMPSCAAWLSWKCQLGSSTAREHVRVARALTALPVIRGEFAAGRFSYAKVRALTRIATPDSDADLAEMAESYIASKTRDVQNPDIYQVIVHATPDAPVPGPPAATPAQPSRCHIEDGPAISRAALQQIACDAVLSRSATTSTATCWMSVAAAASRPRRCASGTNAAAGSCSLPITRGS